ncbi:hypothetical protein HY933_02780 [Candidatus Falkowbacteria bacterium]|nr:hypothetical protein [Candidatus Falkowbacteria bacterium]
MEINIDFSQISAGNPLQVAWWFLANGGWLIFTVVFVWGVIQFWLVRQRSRYFARWDWVILSISVPKINQQAPRAVEYVFTALSGAWKRIDWIERYLTGKVQVSFSFEIISRAGSIEFLARTPRHYRDLVEAAVYAQYPDAEIAEVPDYVERFHGLRWPHHDQGWDIWGTEIVLRNSHFYPIRTWQELFEAANKTQDTAAKDPLSSILEIMAKLRAGEEFWFQIVVTPTNDKWKNEGKRFVRDLMTGHGGHGRGVRHSLLTPLHRAFLEILDMVVYSLVAKPEIEETEHAVADLLPQEQEVLKKIQLKIGKIGFHTYMRAVYIARKEIFQKTKIKEGFLGALHQYTDLHSNGFIQEKYSKVSTSHLYFFPKYRVEHFRKNGMLHEYLTRNTRAGASWGTGFILNVEELASLWHFPIGSMKALVLKKAEFKKAEAPFGLPMERDETLLELMAGHGTDGAAHHEPEEVMVEEDSGPPDNLPTD